MSNKSVRTGSLNSVGCGDLTAACQDAEVREKMQRAKLEQLELQPLGLKNFNRFGSVFCSVNWLRLAEARAEKASFHRIFRLPVGLPRWITMDPLRCMAVADNRLIHHCSCSLLKRNDCRQSFSGKGVLDFGHGLHMSTGRR